MLDIRQSKIYYGLIKEILKMAIWQFQFYIIPRINSEIEIKEDELLSWKKKNISFVKIEFLERKASWTEKIVQFGKEDETCIQFLYEDDILEEINCRLDLRSLSKKMLETILNFVKEIDGMIFYKDEIYLPKFDSIIEIIKNSNASKFCQNPTNFLEDLSKK